ncbi:alpha/beta hydrolase [Kribbella sandramycini]|uniref:Alpha/beta hydrolase n=1 Tax=Kribbella sandramycini TaxID=60450 RepID=A0A7Y4L6P8_9ACTN|nr:alpha/beta hydrolase [Kribbella sandramycini]MBB6571769.1 pimeloyl-ACP methyl ester carboxylesterase [Kribbella sandramycini]NOL44412.1 alpha/beta hydrolase [Kribbella sandramycini]
METTAKTLDTADGIVYYELRGAGPLVVLVGSPMDADSFAPLADLLASDYTVLTTDPRGHRRSPLDDPNHDSRPEHRAGDLAALIKAVGGPAIVFGSSGGAVSALALAQEYPELVRAVIAHEPPLLNLLDDSAEQLAISADLCATYLSGDVLGGWRKFFAQANLELPDGMLELMFGGERDPQAVADEEYWFAHEFAWTVGWQPDLGVLRNTRIVPGIGVESAGQLCERTTSALAAGLGVAPVRFPGDHTGFAEDPNGFLPALRAVLADI